RFAHPLSKSGRAFAQVHGYIKDFAAYHAHQFSLRMLNLIMQPAQHVLSRHGMVVLHELYGAADGLFELRMVVAFEEAAAAVSEYLGFQQEDVWYGQGRGFHQNTLSSSMRRKY